jgi:hypothetical protein
MTDPGRRGSAPALVTAVLVVLVAVAAPLAVARLTGPDGGEHGPLRHAVLDDADRRALDAVPVRRGVAAPADPAVDLTDPVAVTRAYLTVARASGGDDAGRTRLQAAGYAAPGSPPATVGVVVLDPPPPDQVRTAAVGAVDLLVSDGADRRRGYRATVLTATGSPGGAATPAVTTAYVVLARQPDGRWLVVADTPAPPDVAH